MTDADPHKTRLLSPDAGRFIAMPLLAVVHASPFRHSQGEGAWLVSLLLDQLPRFGIPMLVILSGYFFGLKVQRGADPLPMAARLSGRLVLLYFAWCLAYLAPYNLSAIFTHGPLGPIKFGYWNLLDWIRSPQTFLLVGSKIHLWFLPSLFSAIIACGLVLRWFRQEVLLLLSGALYIVGVLAGAYAPSALGLRLPLDTRNGPFFTTLSFATGVALASRRRTSGWLRAGVLLALAGCGLHLAEVFFLRARYGVDPYLDYVFGTYLYGLGVALIFLAGPRLLQLPRVASLGHFTLGIYTTHYFFIDIFAPVDRATQHVLWELGQPVLVYLAALGLTLLMDRSRFTRWMVGKG
jgi:surface polysaccharide O-acyltransferase-like enzyme